MVPTFSRAVSILFAVLAIAVAACSGHIASIGSPAIPVVAPPGLLLRGAGRFAATPPVNPGEVLRYTNFYGGTKTSWSGPTASPVASPYSGVAKITITYGYSPGDHIYSSTYVQRGYTKTTYFGFARLHGGRLQEIIFNDAVAEAGDMVTDFFPAGMLVAILPFAKGASWNDAAADDSSETRVDSVQTAAQRDGSYVAQGHRPNGQPLFTATLSVDGSGRSNYLKQRYSPSVLIVSLPKRENGHIVIDGSTQQAVPFPQTPKPPQPFVASDWYPDKQPQPLYTDTTRVVGGAVRTPGSCRTQANVLATETIETYYRLDPIQGYDIISKQTNYYHRDGTAVCQIRNMTISTYDDVTFGGKPLSRVSETDRYVLTSAKGAPAAIPPLLAALPVHPLDSGLGRFAATACARMTACLGPSVFGSRYSP